jgi:hypothetical protein
MNQDARNSASSFRKREHEALNISIIDTDDISDVFYKADLEVNLCGNLEELIIRSYDPGKIKE